MSQEPGLPLKLVLTAFGLILFALVSAWMLWVTSSVLQASATSLVVTTELEQIKRDVREIRDYLRTKGWADQR